MHLKVALELAQIIAAQPPLAVMPTKEAVRTAFETTLQEGLEIERKNLLLLLTSQDQREGMRGFLEKRLVHFLTTRRSEVLLYEEKRGLVMNVLIEKNLMIAMRDGVKLTTDLYRPVADGPFPTLVARTPYNKNLPMMIGSSLMDVLHLV